MKRLAEINARKLEIREMLEDENKEVNLEEIKKELADLEEETNKIKERIAMAQKINEGKVEVKKPEEKEEEVKKEGEEREMNKEVRENLLNGKTINLNEVRAHGVAGDNSVDELVQMSFEASIIKKLEDVSPLYNMVRKVRTSSPHQFTLQGGKIGKFVKTAELANYVQQHANFETKVMNAYKYTNLVAFSKEIMEDGAFNIEVELRNQLAEALEETYSELIVKGDADVEGLLQCDKAEGAKEVKVAAAGKVDADDILEVYYALKEVYRKNAVWVMSDATAKELAKIKDGVGQPLLYTSYNVSPVGPQTMIMGRPVVIDNNMPSIADAEAVKAIVFCDLERALCVGERQGLEIVRSTEFGFLNDSIAVKANFRLDIKLMCQEAIAYLLNK